MFNETKILFPGTSADVGSSVIKLFVLPAPVIWLSNLLIMNLSDEGYSINALCALNLISTFYYNVYEMCHKTYNYILFL